MPPKNVMSLSDAVAAKAELDVAINEIRRELRNHRRREVHAARMPAQTKAAASILLCRTGGDMKLLGRFLQWKAGTSPEGLKNWARSLSAWYEKLDPEGVRFFAGRPSAPHDVRAAKIVDTFLRERGLHSWVLQQNESHSISPSTGVMLQQLAAQNLGGEAKGVKAEPRKYRSSLQYLRRWRRRWSVSRSSFQPLECLSPEVMKLKVAACREAAFVQHRVELF
jgi:hypothetical protein